MLNYIFSSIGSPQMMPNMNGIMRQQGRNESPQRNDLNNHVMAQLNSQINNIDINDLPPPPPIPQVILFCEYKI